VSGNHTPWATAWQLSYTGDEWHFAREASFSPSDIERGIVRNITPLNPSSQAEIERLRTALKPFAMIAEMEHRAEVGASVMVNVERCRDARAALSGSKE
jgi:hypothetical protein